MKSNFSKKEAACRNGIPYPPAWEYKLKKLFQTLEIIRALTGRSMKLNSVYRTKEYNKKINGAKNSQHVKGLAADFVLEGMTPFQLFPILDRFQRLGVIPKGGLHAYKTFTHIDIRGRIARW